MQFATLKTDRASTVCSDQIWKHGVAFYLSSENSIKVDNSDLVTI
jgi:hypothetical protein